MEARHPLVVIVGPTASGKSSVAMKLASEFDGEIICADSRTVYRGMDIGTAKPTIEDQQLIPHHLLDVVDPDERFTAADFQHQARQAIDDIRSRGNIPFLVGGTGLYVDSVVLNYEFGSQYDPKFRHQLEAMSLEQLHKYCKTNNIKLPENSKNKRYVVRNIERNGSVVRSNTDNLSTSIIVGIATEKNELNNRIVQRTEHIFENGVVDEAILLGKNYGWDIPSMTGNIYPIARKVIDGELNIEQAKEKFIFQDRQLAKRQMTWLKRNDFIQWKSLDDAYDYVKNQLHSR